MDNVYYVRQVLCFSFALLTLMARHVFYFCSSSFRWRYNFGRFSMARVCDDTHAFISYISLSNIKLQSIIHTPLTMLIACRIKMVLHLLCPQSHLTGLLSRFLDAPLLKPNSSARCLRRPLQQLSQDSVNASYTSLSKFLPPHLPSRLSPLEMPVSKILATTGNPRIPLSENSGSDSDLASTFYRQQPFPPNLIYKASYKAYLG